ncbi:hypothetical protein J2045_001569 [Peteryoungia aggregata LMG 23059]|uniref:DUF2125 domain-containing protein n=1 Tax=Peteryoungia aggregata LMG 23059 TaxID=1368425 RepID=A0ABU0G5D2_9HYPH|nr:DUF2125 domain-containing protein [Peteryoungia aggregata]MDQ0420545.1 hypothetical protein [Peteryoungia aggregata LMG 23059]
MAIPTAPQSPISSKVLRLGVLIVLVIAVYSVAWYFAAEFLRNRILSFFGGGNPAGVTASCEDATMGGYPFRFRLNCSRLSLDDHFQGVAASFGPVRAAAQIYNPGHVVWEMDAPAEIRSALGFNTALDWTNMQSSFRIGLSGLSRSSLMLEGLNATVTSTVSSLQLQVTAPSAQSHVRQNEGNLDYATLVRDVTVSVDGEKIALPPVSASLDATFADKGGLLDPRIAQEQKLYGTKGEIRRMVVDLGEGRVLTLSGPFEVGDDGLLSGRIKIEVEQIRAWRDAVKKAYPEQADMVDNVANVLRALAFGRDDSEAEITIQNGIASLGFIPLGQIPPL